MLERNAMLHCREPSVGRRAPSDDHLAELRPQVLLVGHPLVDTLSHDATVDNVSILMLSVLLTRRRSLAPLRTLCQVRQRWPQA